MDTITREIDDIIFKSDRAERVLKEIIGSGILDENAYEVFFRIRVFKSETFLQDFIKGLLATDKATLLVDSINIIAIEAINLVKAAIQTKSEMLTSYLVENFEKIAQINSYNMELLNEFRKLGIDKERLRSIQENAVNEISGNDFLKFIQSANGYEGFQIELNYDSFTKHLLKKEESVMQDEVLLQMISRLIQELCEHEGIKITQIEFGGSGYYNTNLKIGEFVLKIAPSNRKTVKIRNDKRIIKPILRQQTNAERRKNIPNLFIEIQNVVKTNWYDGLSEKQIQETLYSIFSELMDRGLRWTDIKKENIGSLIKPNTGTYTFDGKEQTSNNYVVSYYGEEPQEVLGPDKLVIIDTDYIYETKWTKNIKIPRESCYPDFLKRYEREHEKEKVQEREINDSVKKIIIEGGYTPEKTRNILSKLWRLVTNRFKGR